MNDSYDGDEVVVDDSAETGTESTQETTTESTAVTTIDSAKDGHGKEGEGSRNTNAGETESKTGETTAPGGRHAESGTAGGKNAEGSLNGGRGAETGKGGKADGEEAAARSGRIDVGRKGGKAAEDGKATEATQSGKTEAGARGGRNPEGGKAPEPGRDGKAAEKGNAAKSGEKNAVRKEKEPSMENKEKAEARAGSEKTEEDKPGKYPPQEVVTIDGQRYRTDDNGNIHMFYDRDTKEWNMIANNEYKSHGYTYRTDGNGDIVHAEGRIDRSGDRKPLNDKVPGLQEGDDRGHIIADRNDASNHRDNLFPQLSEKNRGEYKAMENHVAKAAEDPENDVHMSVDLVYPKDGDTEHRPDWVYVTITINGREENYQFDNRRDS